MSVTFDVWIMFHIFGVSVYHCIMNFLNISWARTQVTLTTGSAHGTLTSSGATAPAEMARIEAPDAFGFLCMTEMSE